MTRFAHVNTARHFFNDAIPRLANAAATIGFGLAMTCGGAFA